MPILKRLKNLVVSLAVAGGLWTAPVLAAGTTPLSMVQQFDQTGQPLAGCLLYFFAAGTVAQPQDEFTDFGLTSKGPNPLTCDQSGRIPQHWLADGLIHIRLTDSSGLPIIDTTMQVLGPSSGGGGGGGGTVDPTTILATGDIKARYGTGVLSGFVRENGLTIGNVTCGCTERSNNDTQALFIYLYTVDPNLVVSGGRTGNALNDFNASKQLALPDGRGRALAGLDDMGSSAAGRLTSSYFGASAIVLGATGGNEKMPGLATTNMPPYTPTGSVSQVTGTANLQGGSIGGSQAGVALYGQNTSGVNILGPLPLTLSAQTIAINPQGGTSAPFSTVSPTMVMTIYLKL